MALETRKRIKIVLNFEFSISRYFYKNPGLPFIVTRSFLFSYINLKQLTMKNQLFKLVLLAVVVIAAFSFSNSNTHSSDSNAANYEWQQVTVVESVIEMGIGRSRIISTGPNGKLSEEKIMNLFSATGINFGNIQKNDAKISSTISNLSNQGWELVDVTTGVSMYGQDNSDGIYMTRYLFRRSK